MLIKITFQVSWLGVRHITALYLYISKSINVYNIIIRLD